jgi:phage terminase large subunit-like protein
MNNYIYEYYQHIEDGSEVVGKWIKLLYEKIVKGIEDGQYVFDQKKANKAIRFIEKFCRHNKGKLAPQLIKLALWQKAFLSVLYGILDHDGHRQFREVILVVGRKQGKTLLAAGIQTYEAYADGEYGSEIYDIAPKLDQSDLVFSAFEFNKDHCPALANITRKRKNDVFIEKTNTTVKKIAFSEKKADGYNPMLTIADEMSSWPAERGLKQWEVMVSGTGARTQPITMAISSSGYVNDGPYDELVKRGTAFLMGNSKEQRLLPVLYMIDDVEKWDDINELRKSLPNLGVSVPVQFILDEINIASDSLSKRAEFITKYCNIKQNSSQAWLDSVSIEQCAGEHLNLEDFKGTYCVGGIDLSQTTDLTACNVIIQRADKLYMFNKFFMPSSKVDELTAAEGIPYRIYIQRGELQVSGENFVDYRDCFNWFRELVEKYSILPLQIGYDRYSAQYLVQDLQAYGFHVDDVYQGENLTSVIHETEGIIKDGRLNIGDNQLLKMHLYNSALKTNAETNRVKLIKIEPRAHIDGMAALLDSICVRQKHWNEIGGQLANEGR